MNITFPQGFEPYGGSNPSLEIFNGGMYIACYIVNHNSGGVNGTYVFKLASGGVAIPQNQQPFTHDRGVLRIVDGSLKLLAFDNKSLLLIDLLPAPPPPTYGDDKKSKLTQAVNLITQVMGSL